MVKKYSKKRKGGDDTDIETGVQENFTPVLKVPADPLRFDKFNAKMRNISFNPITKREAEGVFARPNPEEKRRLEAKSMFNEDPLYTNPYNESFKMWNDKGGKRKTKKRKMNKKKSNKRKTNKNRSRQ